jgi:hypothetical protein
LLNYAPSPSGYAGHVGEILDCAAAQGRLLPQAGPVVPRFVSPLNDRDDELAEGEANGRRAARIYGDLIPTL